MQRYLKLNVDPVFFSRGFKVGFNSLCAFASVNHLHLHAYYLEHDLFVDNCVRQLKLAGGCSSYFFPFYVSLKNVNISGISEKSKIANLKIVTGR